MNESLNNFSTLRLVPGTLNTDGAVLRNVSFLDRLRR